MCGAPIPLRTLARQLAGRSSWSEALGINGGGALPSASLLSVVVGTASAAMLAVGAFQTLPGPVAVVKHSCVDRRRPVTRAVSRSSSRRGPEVAKLGGHSSKSRTQAPITTSTPTTHAHSVPELPAHTIDYALSGSFAEVVKYGLSSSTFRAKQGTKPNSKITTCVDKCSVASCVATNVKTNARLKQFFQTRQAPSNFTSMHSRVYPSEWTFAKSSSRPLRKPGARKLLSRDTTCFNHFQIFESKDGAESSSHVREGVQPTFFEDMPPMPSWIPKVDSRISSSSSTSSTHPSLQPAGSDPERRAPADEDDDVNNSCVAVPQVPTLTESQALTTAQRRHAKFKWHKFQDELPESFKSFFGSMSPEGCCDAHVASQVPDVSSPAVTRNHIIDNPLAAQISLRACPAVSSPDDAPRHRAQASWPDVASLEVARGIGAAMALPTGAATARSH